MSDMVIPGGVDPPERVPAGLVLLVHSEHFVAGDKTHQVYTRAGLIFFLIYIPPGKIW